MRNAFGLLLALAAANPVNAQSIWTAESPPEIKTGPGTRYYSGLPPVRFVKGGLVPVLFVHPDQLYEACGAPKVEGLELKGCARMMKTGQKAIIIPHPCLSLDGQYTVILCHETAHAIASWPGDHPL